MAGVLLRVGYDGSRFAGWARQPGQRTVQGELESAIAKLTNAPILTRGASRTDAGVHAHDQAVALDCELAIPLYGWVHGLNAHLADDLAVRSASECAPGYQPRFDAKTKTYRYLIHLGPARDPLLANRAWHLGPRRARSGLPKGASATEWLHVDAMREAASHFVGEHDFRAFRTSSDRRENTIRTLRSLQVIEAHAGNPELLAIEVEGTAFMHNMVRILVGTLLEVGRERREPGSVRSLLGTHAFREHAGETAPAHGLYLVRVELGR